MPSNVYIIDATTLIALKQIAVSYGLNPRVFNSLNSDGPIYITTTVRQEAAGNTSYAGDRLLSRWLDEQITAGRIRVFDTDTNHPAGPKNAGDDSIRSIIPQIKLETNTNVTVVTDDHKLSTSNEADRSIGTAQLLNENLLNGGISLNQYCATAIKLEPAQGGGTFTVLGVEYVSPTNGYTIKLVYGGLEIKAPNGIKTFVRYDQTFKIDDIAGTVTILRSGIRCFLAGTPILLSDGTVRPIETIAVGDPVAAFAGGGEFDGVQALGAALEGRSVTRLFANVTREVIAIRHADPETGTERTVYATPGHVMLTASGRFLEARRALLAGEDFVLADGRAVAARYELIRFESAAGQALSATHPAFAPVTDLVMHDEHGLALAPQEVTGWRHDRAFH